MVSMWDKGDRKFVGSGPVFGVRGDQRQGGNVVHKGVAGNPTGHGALGRVREKLVREGEKGTGREPED